jgi:hypothetical protein
MGNDLFQMRTELRRRLEQSVADNSAHHADASQWELKYTKKEIEGAAERVQLALAERGWYMPFGNLTIDEILKWERGIGDLSPDDLGQELTAYARTRVDKAEDEAYQLWPQRVPILKDAFAAHRNALFTLSIPAMLAQADGICDEILGAPMFGKERANPAVPRTAAAIEKHLATITCAGKPFKMGWTGRLCINSLRILNALSRSTVAHAKTAPSDQVISPLNRHGVLHGIDVDYANEASSLRCILAIDCLNGARRMLDFHLESAANFDALWKRAMRETRPEK